MAVPVSAATRDPLVTYLRNPGFESIDAPTSTPLYWDKFREAFVDSNPVSAYSGSNSVRSSYLFGWAQSLIPAVSAGQSFAITGQARAEFSFEQPATRVAYVTAVAPGYAETFDGSPTTNASGWGEFWTVHEMTPDVTSLQVFLAGRGAYQWIRFDDLHLCTEQFQTSGSLIGEPWVFAGGASESSGTLTLPPSSIATQRVVSSHDSKRYYVAGSCIAASPGNLVITDQWLPRGAGESTATASQSVTIPAGPSAFLADLIPLAGYSTGISNVSIANATSGTATVTRLIRGFASVEPTTLTTGANSPDKDAVFIASMPDQISTASVEILNSSNILVTTLPIKLRGATLKGTWNGGVEPTGTYTARFKMLNTAGDTVELTRPLHLVRDNGLLASVPAYRLPDFARGAWLFVYFESDPARITDSFRLAKQDGFNFAYVQCRTDQLPAVRAAAETYSMPFVISLNEVRSVFSQNSGSETFSSSEYVQQVRGYLDPVLTSTLYRGVYVVDEPAGDTALDTTRRCLLSLAQDGTLGPGWTVLPGNLTATQVGNVNPATCWLDIYPFRSATPLANTDALLAEIPNYRKYAAAAASLGRDFWLVGQGFEGVDFELFRGVPNSMHWAQLGAAVMAGARGVLPFTYNSINYLEGIIGPDFEDLRKTPVYRQFNALMDDLSPLLMQLSVPDLLTTAPRPFAASVAQAGPANRYLFVLNADDLSQQTLLVGMSSSPTGLIDLVQQRSLGVDASNRLMVDLGAGEWALIPIGNRTVTSFAGNFSGPPSLSTLNLPITHQFTVQRPGGQPQPAAALSFSADGTKIAVSSPDYWYEPAAPQVYTLGGGGSVTRATGPLRYPNERTCFVDGSNLLRSSVRLGAYFFDPSNLAGAPARQFAGYSGGAFSAVRNGSTFWMTQLYYGIRQVTGTSGELMNQANGFSESDYYGDIFGPFADNSVCAIVRNNGIHNIKPGLLAENQHVAGAMNRVEDNSAMNSLGMVAMPRHQRGFGLVKLDASGAPLWLVERGEDLVDCTAVAWINDTTLAAADGVYNVRLYHVQSDGTTNFAGMWRPVPSSEPIFVRSLATGSGNRLAVGLHDGRVFVADPSNLVPLPAGCGTEWVNYE
ncbi:MAG: hypothetical protein K1X53_09760 [Candidatus Sumerlaeaceae bacterium]|nr:hypothetical protein [Candidatus Sumerlaeaceae bacterium]